MDSSLTPLSISTLSTGRQQSNGATGTPNHTNAQSDGEKTATPTTCADDETVPRLDRTELEQLKRTIGPTSSILASAVTKLYVCLKGESEYSYTGIWGALLLVVDRTPPTSKALQIYSLHPSTPHYPSSESNSTAPLLECLFSVQLYESLAYLSPNHLFHTFEIDVGLVGFSFGDIAGAHDFLVKVRAAIPPHGTVSTRPPKKSSFFARLFGASPRDARPTRESISAPTGVVKNQLPEEWQTLFKNAATIANNKHRTQLSGDAAIPTTALT